MCFCFRNENGALVIIYQNAEQARRMSVFDNSIVLLDVSYKGKLTFWSNTMVPFSNSVQVVSSRQLLTCMIAVKQM